MKIKST